MAFSFCGLFLCHSVNNVSDEEKENNSYYKNNTDILFGKLIPKTKEKKCECDDHNDCYGERYFPHEF